MYGDYINRYKRSIKFRKEPILDVLLAVDNLKQFHKENMHTNYKDYTYFARMTHGYPVTFF